MADTRLFYAVVALLTISLVMSYSLGVFTVLRFGYEEFHFFIRQGVAVIAGIFVMVALSKLDADKWFVPLGMVLFVGSFSAMLAMQVMPSSLVTEVGGAKRWIRIGSMSIAPVEFFKVGFVFFLAWSFSRKLAHKQRMGFFEELRAYAPYIVVFLFAVVLIAIFQKDLGQVVVLGATLMVMFILIGSSYRFFLLMLGGIVAAFVALIFAAPHRVARIKSWWISVQDTILSIFPIESLQKMRIEGVNKEPWQISNSLNAIHNGGFFGQGLGNGQFKLGYLSEVHTDFVMAGIAEELGFFGVLIVTVILLYILYRIIFKIAKQNKNPMYYLFSVGVAMLISFAFLLNVYGISGLTPIKGIAVPFLSYGGSHILAASVAIGMVLMVSKKVRSGV